MFPLVSLRKHKYSRPHLAVPVSLAETGTSLRPGQLKNSAQALFFFTLSAQQGSILTESVQVV